MNLRLALYEWSGRHRLDGGRGRELFELAGYGAEPPALARRFWPAVAVAAGALGGLGVILWLAANWNDLGRMGRFALLQAALLVLCVGAALQPRARPGLALMAMLCIGGLFAWFGQTYQTGADPWQLFALWAVLALPLCLGVRSDVLWAPWSLVVMVGISLWVHAHIGHRWRLEPRDLDVYLLAWLACALVVAWLSPLAARITGAGPWALRTAATLAVAMVAAVSLGALFAKDIAPHYWAGLAVFGAAAALLLFGPWFEVFLLSAVALGLDTLLVAGLARGLFDRAGGDTIGRLMLVGLVAAGLLAASVSVITRKARRHG